MCEYANLGRRVLLCLCAACELEIFWVTKNTKNHKEHKGHDALLPGLSAILREINSCFQSPCNKIYQVP